MSPHRQTASRRPTLPQALRTHLSPIAQATSSYKTQVCYVNTYVNNVLGASLPTVSPQPQDWQSYLTAWEQASSDALNWVNTCMARLLSVPQDVVTYNDVVSSLLADAVAQAQVLVANPQDQAARTALNNDLSEVPGQLNLVSTFIAGAIKGLQGFQDVLPDMATQLTTLSNLAASDNQADQQQIQALVVSIGQLQAEVDSLTAALVALGIADGAAITLGLLATVAAFPVGAVVWLFVGPVVAVATTFIALDAEKLEAAQAQIKTDQAAMKGLTQACGVLAGMSTQYADLASGSTAVQDALQAILDAWQAMAGDIVVAVADLQTAINDTNAGNFQAVLADLQDAQTEWQSTTTQATSLVLDLQVNNAALQIGMSPADLQTALSSGQVVSLIDYFNSTPAARRSAALKQA